MADTKFASFLYDQGDRITLLKRILTKLGNPDQDFSIIHVCGTNGKGSTSMMIAACLETMGQKVGLFTSPFIGDQTNSIQINSQSISQSQLAGLTGLVKNMMVTPQFANDELSDFEALFLIAMLYFSNQSVDYVVLECGLGGELDATNAVTTTQYSIFTEIGLDHVGILGSTIEKITATKSKIIRPGNTTIIAPQHSDAVNRIIREEARSKGAKVIDAGRFVNVKYQKLNSQLIIDYQTTKLAGTFKFGLIADYQLENLRTVLTWLINFFQSANTTLTIDEILEHSLSQISIPGRFEMINESPVMIVDGAHNLDGIRSFVDSVNTNFESLKKVIVVGFLKDKDYQDSVDQLSRIKHATFIISEPANDSRKLSGKQLRQTFYNTTHIKYPAIKDPIDAINAAKIQSGSLDLVVGSFYLLNPIRTYIKSLEDNTYDKTS